MLKSIRFWAAVLLVLSSVGYSKFREQYLLNRLPAETQEKITSTATEPYQTIPEQQELPTEKNAPVPLLTETDVSYPVSETETVLICQEQPTTAEIVENDASVPYLSEQKLAEMTERFRIASEYSENLIGWIYLADSEIDYPVVQGNDNQYYLHHAPDGNPNQLGSIFLDCHCHSDFSDKQNILFGHNMQSGMFGDIRSLKDKDCFEQHRYGWLLTKNGLYRIDFYALVIISAYDTIYDIPADDAEWQNSVKEHSMYYTETEISEDDCFLALSTCASDFENARALFVGILKPTIVKEGK